jgi:hypothetical protein
MLYMNVFFVAHELSIIDKIVIVPLICCILLAFLPRAWSEDQLHIELSDDHGPSMPLLVNTLL